MKKLFLVKSVALTAILVSGVAFATAPDNMSVTNNTKLYTNAYIHSNPSKNPLAPGQSELIPWSAVTQMCHGTGLLKGEDPCAFEVYGSTKSSDPQQYDIGTVTFYVSNGDLVNIHSLSNKFKIVYEGPGTFKLVSRKA